MPAKIAIIIPARWGSTRFPGKALHLLAGKPLVQRVWERCVKVRGAQKVIIATDDIRIAEAAFGFGAEVAITSDQHVSGTDRIAEVAAKLRGISHVINVQGDEPLIEPKLIAKLAKVLTDHPKIGMITAANVFGEEEDPSNPNAVKVVLDRKGNALYFSRSLIPYVRGVQALPIYRHQGIYGYQRKFLLQFVQWKPSLLEQTEQLEQLRALENGAKIRVLITKYRSTGVDSPEDAENVERLLGQKEGSSNLSLKKSRRAKRN